MATIPQPVGSLRFPNWLMRDWEPAFQNRSANVENDPNELPNYGVAYAQFLEMALLMIPTSCHRSKELTRITRSSLGTRTLEIGASDPLLISDIMKNFFDQMRRAKALYLNEASSGSCSEGSTLFPSLVKQPPDTPIGAFYTRRRVTSHDYLLLRYRNQSNLPEYCLTMKWLSI